MTRSRFRDEVESAYLAGLIDGEGCFMLTGNSMSPVFSLAMSMKTGDLLPALARRWGGSVTIKRQATDRHAGMFDWHNSGVGLLPLLNSVRPHVRLKLRQVELLVESCAVRKAVWSGRRWNVRYKFTDAQRERLFEIRQECSEANRKGPDGPAMALDAVASTRLFDDLWTVNDRAYLGGLIDGEGCLMIDKDLFKATLWLAMTVKADPLLKHLHRSWGGTLKHIDRNVPGWSRSTAWVVRHDALRSLLPAVIPHLRLKRAQADLLIKSLTLKQDRVRWTNQQRRELQHEYRYAVMALNRKGPSVPYGATTLVVGVQSEVRYG